MIFIGIDPGKDGGIAYITDQAFTFPYSDEKLLEICKKFTNEERYCVVEKVGAMPKQGVTSMFNFGRSFGYILGVLEATSTPYELVTPQRWKKEFSLSNDKHKSIKCCQRLFPNISLKRTERCTKDHDGMAESLLIALFAQLRRRD